jgi:pSer/pThr/pTyr-binding forkhead associated (FHA) protein
MVRLDILSGNKAGTQWLARRFPVRIGRAAGNDLQLEDNGVWDRHLELRLENKEGFLLAAMPDAVASVNRQPLQTARLRNGDFIELGAVRLQFWLAETRQRGLLVRESLVWFLIAAISLSEVAAVYLLLQ